MIKPDGVQRGLVGEIVSRFERRGLKLVAMRMLTIDEALARRHYAAHVDKGFFPTLLAYITSSPVVAMVWEAPSAISLARQMLGPTDATQAPGGTLRGDFCLDIGFNLVHGSDSPQAAQREIELFFDPDLLMNYDKDLDRWLCDSD